jgi:DNA-binding protein Alba
MPAECEVYKDADGKFRFRFKAENNRIVAVGEAYEQHASCIKGIKSIQKNCTAEIEDLTVESDTRVSNPKYQVFTDTSSKYRFRLLASNGEVIAQSEGYETKDGCFNGVESFKRICNAEINDLTQTTKTNGSAAPAVAKAEVSASSKTILIGNKMPMDYVLAIITGFSSTDARDITLMARGKSIATAVDAAEIARNRFLKDVKVKSISLGTQEMPAREDETKPRNVSTIEIVLTKR